MCVQFSSFAFISVSTQDLSGRGLGSCNVYRQDHIKKERKSVELHIMHVQTGKIQNGLKIDAISLDRDDVMQNHVADVFTFVHMFMIGCLQTK